MGKATVYSHLGGGRYTILYTPETALVDARNKELDALKTALDEQLYSTNGLVEARTAAQAVYDAASGAFFVALDDWAACASMFPACPEQAALMQIVVQRGTARAEAGAALTVVKSAIAENRSEYFAVTQEIAFLNATKKGSGAGLMEAWCIDFNGAEIIPENTVVGTIETYGAKGGYAGGYLPRKWVNIQTSRDPGYDAARDHCVKPFSGMKTAALFFNWCQWLYVMSRNPQHAAGLVLSKFDPHQTYLDVEIFGTTPGAAQPVGYPFEVGTYSVTLLNVPVNYLDCGAELFEAGDWALVKFGGINRDSPVVIGFAQNPRECGSCGGSSWPWRGLATNGVIALPDGSTKVMDTPPFSGDAWAVKNALVAGRIFGGIDIGADAFIFVDADEVCWHVQLSFSYPAENHVRIQASVIPWSEFGGSAAPAIYTATVGCEHIELTSALGNPIGDYDTRSIALTDAWKNGCRALVSVVLRIFGANDLFSVIELSLTGSGGVDGTGLIFAADEVFGQSTLISFSDSGSIPPPENPFCNGLNWVSSVTYQYYLPYRRTIDARWARRAFYDAAGSPRFLALALKYDIDETTCETAWQEASAGETCWPVGAEESIPTVENHLVARISSVVGLSIVNTGVVVDEVTFHLTYFMHEWYTTCAGSFFSGLFIDNDWSARTMVVSGHLGSEFSGVEELPDLTDLNPLISAWRSANDNAAGAESFLDPGWLGLQRIDGSSAAFYKSASSGAARSYGVVCTPNGSKSYAETPTSDIYFSWQRITGNTEFSTFPICYV